MHVYIRNIFDKLLTVLVISILISLVSLFVYYSLIEPFIDKSDPKQSSFYYANKSDKFYEERLMEKDDYKEHCDPR